MKETIQKQAIDPESKTIFDLPAELRNYIYEYTLPANSKVRIRNGMAVVHPILLASRQVRQECHALHENFVETAEVVEADVFDWDFRPVCRYFESAPRRYCVNIKTLEIRLRLTDPAADIEHGSLARGIAKWFQTYHAHPISRDLFRGLDVDVRYTVAVDWTPSTCDQLKFRKRRVRDWFDRRYQLAFLPLGFVQIPPPTHPGQAKICRAFDTAIKDKLESQELERYRRAFFSADPIRGFAVDDGMWSDRPMTWF